MSTFIFDLDGTLHNDDIVVPGAVETVARLRQLGHRVLYATNDATMTRAGRAERLCALGFPSTPQEVATSGAATAAYLASLGDPVGAVLVFGPEAVRQELASVPGIEVVTPADERTDIDAVVMGLDPDFDYDKLTVAARAVMSGARLVATNADRSYLSEDGLMPGAGAMIAAVEAACGVKAHVVGKPRPDLFQALLGVVDRSGTVVVGDSLHTDIAAACGLGLCSVLVLTGVTKSPPDGTDVRPDLVLPSIANLIEELSSVAPWLMTNDEVPG